jgi:hypothetical protein
VRDHFYAGHVRVVLRDLLGVAQRLEDFRHGRVHFRGRIKMQPILLVDCGLLVVQRRFNIGSPDAWRYSQCNAESDN